MKPLAVFAIAATFAAAAIAQPFTISTIAGAVTQPLPALNAGISNPQAMAADTAGNIYFIANGAVYKLDESGGTVTHIAGITASGYSGDGGPAISAQLDGPMALAIDPAANLYIAEAGGHIRKVGADGIITTIAGNGVCHGGCFTDGAGDGGPAIKCRHRRSVWVRVRSRRQSLFLRRYSRDDYAPDAVRVRKISAEGIITTVAGYGAPGGITDSTAFAKSIPRV
jgi:trimeric autotransporter adhesin